MWQDLRAELHPKGLEVVTVGMDTAGPEACRPFIEAARPQHPSLIDVGHVMAERFGVINIPNGIWIDEDGMVVRPAEPAPAPRRTPPPGTGSGGGSGDSGPGDSGGSGSGDRSSSGGGGAPDPAVVPARMRQILAEASKIRTDPNAYVDALRDWVEHGRASRFALPPDQVVARSGRRDHEAAEAAAHFALAQHLWRAGRTEAAVGHFRQAHRLQPENFSYKRQAWSLASPGTGPFERFWQGPVEGREEEWPYDSDWLSEVQAMGAENYYPQLDL